MPEVATADRQRPRWRPRLSIGALMLAIALLGLGFAWVAGQARRVALIDLGPPDLIAVGDRAHTPTSLRAYIRAARVEEVVLRCPGDMPYDSVSRVLRAIEEAGVHQIQIRLDPTNGPPKPIPRGAVAPATPAR